LVEAISRRFVSNILIASVSDDIVKIFTTSFFYLSCDLSCFIFSRRVLTSDYTALVIMTHYYVRCQPATVEIKHHRASINY